MRLVIFTSFEPTGIGGVEKVVREFAARLSKRFEVEIVCTGMESRESLLEDIPIHIVKGHLGLYAYSEMSQKVIERLRPDVIYAHNYSTHMPYVADKIKRRCKGVKIALHAHYHYSGSTPLNQFLRKLYDPVIGRRVIRDADVIFANSESELQLLNRTFGLSQPAYVIPNGIDLEAIRAARKLEIAEPIVPILHVGRLEPYKNAEIAVRVMRFLPDYFHLYIIGKGRAMANLKSIVSKMNISQRVHFLGFLSDTEVYQWYQTASVFVHFSNLESFGMTCVEALAARTPCVANEDGFGLSETISIFREYIASCNIKVHSLYEIARIIESSAKRKPVDADVKLFDWNNISEKLAEILENLA